MKNIATELESLRRITSAESTYVPHIWSAADPETGKRVRAVNDSGKLQAVYDTFLAQHRELIETRHPEIEAGSPALSQLAHDALGGVDPSACGNWVMYPWSGTLVHVLSEPEFRELRTSRNRNKITVEEQEKLRSLVIGIVGLSVGLSTAVTLATEEVGGTFVLADFDTLSLSNLNRVRASVHAIGVNKSVIAARQILEINPYVKVILHTAGVSDDNIDEFFGTGSTSINILIEECDDLYMKVRLREVARSRGIPVLMETSERGMLDIERFDHEPDRPLLHGLAEGLNAGNLRSLTNSEKVPIVLKMLGEQLSPRSAASMLEIGSTLRTWPQLASAVTLGGSLTTDVVRRIALDQIRESGRYHVDLEAIIADGKSEVLQSEAPPAIEAAEPHVSMPPLPAIAHLSDLSAESIRTLVAYASLAPSGGNCQPWRFEYNQRTLRCIHDVARSASYLDWQHRASYLAFGAAIENLELAAAEMGMSLEVLLFPRSNDPTIVCDVVFHPDRPVKRDTELFEHIAQRVTNRRLGLRTTMSKVDSEQLSAEATVRGRRLQLLLEPDDLDRMGELLGTGDRLRFASPLMHREMMAEIRWNDEQARSLRDGLDVATLEMTPTEIACMRLASHGSVMELITKVGGGAAFEKPSKKAVASACAIGLVTASDSTPQAYFVAGRAMQRVWLKATGLGYAFQPMTAITYLFARLLARETEPLQSREVAKLDRLYQSFVELFPATASEPAAMLFRLSRTDPPTARALRRNVDDILKIL